MMKLVFSVAVLFDIVYSQIFRGDVKLFLYNKAHREKPLQLNSLNVREKQFEDAKLKMLCHGIKSGRSIWYGSIINAYLKNGYNVIAVDWSDFAFSGYLHSIFISNDIASVLADYMIAIHETNNISYEKMHIIGHSLGAHVAGMTGKLIFKRTRCKIGRITGLDPAGPLFEIALESKSLCRDDATFVDVIHTDMSLYGISKSIGHVDFFPNGGYSQSGCSIFETNCNHHIVSSYFTESIISKNFVSVKCRSNIYFILGLCKNNEKNIMGENTNITASGNFYLRTNSKNPYGKGKV